MHDSVMDFVWEAAALRGTLAAKRVLDVGSLNVNGSTRPVWPDAEYIGIDGRPGDGVDIVAMSWEMPFPDAHFDVVVCTEMLEHDADPILTFTEVQRVLKPSGTFILTCRGPGFGYHEEPHDYWRFTPKQIRQWLKVFLFTDIHSTEDPGAPGVLAVATRNANSTVGPIADVPALTPVQ